MPETKTLSDIEKKAYVKQTILSGDKDRIKKVMLRYWESQKQDKVNVLVNAAKEIFS